MLEKLSSYLIFGNRFSAIEQTQINGDPVYYGITLKKRNKTLDIENRFETSTIESLATHLPKSRGISLSINDDSVIIKNVNTNEKNIDKLIYMAFPNIKIDDFYFDVLKQENNCIVSLIRKTHLEKILESYNSIGIHIVDIHLGSLLFSTISKFIVDDEVHISNGVIHKSEAEITSISKIEQQKEKSYNVNGVSVNNQELLSFSAALNLIVQNNVITSNYTLLKNQLSKTYYETIYTKLFPKIGLGLLFFILLINFFYFNYYYNEVTTLRETTQVLEGSKLKLVTLKDKVLKTEQLVEDVLKSAASKSSFYTDAIVSNLPESILLSEFSYQPLEKRIKENKPVDVRQNFMRISGESKVALDFSQWLSDLEKSDWITSVDILNFDESSQGFANFTIGIQIKNDTKK